MSGYDAQAPGSLCENAGHSLVDDFEAHLAGELLPKYSSVFCFATKVSFLSQDPSWKPFKEFATTGRQFGMAELIKQAMKA